MCAGENPKKTVGCVVLLTTGGPLQFPEGTTWKWVTRFDRVMLVCYNPDGDEIFQAFNEHVVGVSASTCFFRDSEFSRKKP